MKGYYGLEVFYFGKYFTNLTSDTQRNRVLKKGDNFDFSSVDLKKVLSRNKIILNNEDVSKIKKNYLKTFVYLLTLAMKVVKVSM